MSGSWSQNQHLTWHLSWHLDSLSWRISSFSSEASLSFLPANASMLILITRDDQVPAPHTSGCLGSEKMLSVSWKTTSPLTAVWETEQKASSEHIPPNDIILVSF